MKTYKKRITMNVKGNWKPEGIQGEVCKGEWLWKDAENQLLAEFDKWYNSHPIASILSFDLLRKSRRDIEAGASVLLVWVYRI